MFKPIKNVTTVVRDVPRGKVSIGGGALTDLRDGDLLSGYTFGAGDLHGDGTPQSMNTPVAVVQVSDNDFLHFTTLDNRVRPKRYYFQNGEKAFRVEVAYEHDAWRNEDSVTHNIDGNQYNLDWVDWNNDRHQDGWLAYMNLGSDPWRLHMEGRISEMIAQFGVDAYFLDIVGGHVNSTTGDMHEGTRRMIMNLRAKYPKVVGVGEMPYDALFEFIPMFHAGGGGRWSKYARFYSHLSAPAAGRGSSGVHESGFGRFNTPTLGLNPNAIPTLQIVDDTFTKYRDVMTQIIAAAKTQAGIA